MINHKMRNIHQDEKITPVLIFVCLCRCGCWEIDLLLFIISEFPIFVCLCVWTFCWNRWMGEKLENCRNFTFLQWHVAYTEGKEKQYKWKEMKRQWLKMLYTYLWIQCVKCDWKITMKVSNFLMKLNF